MHKSYTITKIKKENSRVVSIFLAGKIKSTPGQFVMLWIPGIGEKPFAISYKNNKEFGITIEEKGVFTKEIKNLKVNDKVGIRGPFGNGFTQVDNSIVVAGGLGIAPSMSLIKNIKNSIIIQGAKSKEYLLYMDNKELLDSIEKNNNKIIYCTDDGSFGIKGFTTEILKEMLNKTTKTIYTCGPEIMMLKVIEIAKENNIPCQASLERFMKCGIGICASCAINNQLVCKDGPVFNQEQIAKLTELGKFARLKSGKKVELKEYYEWKSK